MLSSFRKATMKTARSSYYCSFCSLRSSFPKNSTGRAAAAAAAARPPRLFYSQRLSTTISSLSTTSMANTSMETLLLERNKEKARELLNQNYYPRGSYCRSRGIEAKNVLDFFRECCSKTDVECANLSIALWERLVTEMALYRQKEIDKNKKKKRENKRKEQENETLLQKTPNYPEEDEEVEAKVSSIFNPRICDPLYYAPLLDRHWRVVAAAAKKESSVVSPRDLLLKLQIMSRLLPDVFRYNIVVVNIILKVEIKQQQQQQQQQQVRNHNNNNLSSVPPYRAEQLLQFVRNEAEHNEQLQPDTYTYNTLLQAWARSGAPNAPQQMDLLLQRMREQQRRGRAVVVKPDTVTYGILLRYWAGRGAVRKLDALLDQMQRVDGLTPTIPCLAQAVYGYAVKARETARAEDLLLSKQMLHPQNEREYRLVGESVQNILLTYRRIVIMSTVNDDRRKEQAVHSAERLVEKMRKRADINDEEQIKLMTTMMDIYVRAGMHDKVETAVFEDGRPVDSMQLSIVMKALGKADQADKATAILKRILLLDEEEESVDKERESAVVELDVECFNTVINAWAESSQDDAMEQAYAIVRLMKENPQCEKLGVKPDRVTFHSLLKCLSKSVSGRNDTSAKVVEILDEMEHLYYKARYNDTKPDALTFRMAIHACLEARDADSAEIVMGRMETSDIVLDIRAYSDIMNYWAKQRTRTAAERAEKILKHMQQRAAEKTTSSSSERCSSSQIKLNAFAYNICMNAWAKSGGDSDDAYERIWDLYKQMKNDKHVQPDFVTYTTLIPFLARSRDRMQLERADSLLQVMENSQRKSSSSIQPDFRHFESVLVGWLGLDQVENAAKVLSRMTFTTCMNNRGNKATYSAAKVRFLLDLVVQGCIKVGDLNRAVATVEKIQYLKDANRLPEGPSSGTYSALLEAWTKSSEHHGRPEKAAMTLKLQERLFQLRDWETQKATVSISSNRWSGR